MDNALRVEIEALFDEAADGRHYACLGCSRNPQVGKTAFARPCLDHYGIAKNGLLFVLRDPGASSGGASHSGKLCPIDNSDRTAGIIRRRLEQIRVPSELICFSNAILHGYYDKNSRADNEKERKKCKMVLGDLIGLLQPKIVIALGLEALRSVREILLQREMPKPTVKEMAERQFSFECARGSQILGLPHPAHEAPNLSPYKLRPDDAWGIVSRRVNSVFSANCIFRRPRPCP